MRFEGRSGLCMAFQDFFRERGYPGIWNAVQGLSDGLDRSGELSRKMLTETDRKSLCKAILRDR